MTYIIAEIGQAHDGSLGILHSYVDALADTGINAVKCQTHIAAAESSAEEPFRVKFSYEDATRFDYWKRMEFTPDQWAGIRQHCLDCNLDFISSPFSNAAVDLLEKIGVGAYKIGSGETQNLLMLEKIARTQKKIILSSGMSTYAELEKAIHCIQAHHQNIAILQCTTKYPTAPEDIGLNVLTELKHRYPFPIGLSDHSGTIWPCLAAACMGADLIEFHVVFHRQMFGPDSKASLTPAEIKDLVQGIRYMDAMKTMPVDKNNIKKFSSLKTMFGKSLAVNKPLSAGHCLRFGDLESKKPAGSGIDIKNYRSVIGKKLAKSLRKWDFLKEGDLSD